ncbi:uncharacterized protein LOC141850207 [Brevipalpus obovatus]|uniref:uncharacterized protein LOC141850207 n=1 Tax=Brevipalpus obovatus TaxID=246614 RepID=UPI003D9E255C
MDSKWIVIVMMIGASLMIMISIVESLPQNYTETSRLEKAISKSKIELKQKTDDKEEKGSYKPPGNKKPKKPKKPKPSISYPINWPAVPAKPIDQWNKDDWIKFCKSKDQYLPSNQPGLEGKIATFFRCYIELLTLYLMGKR